MVTITPFRGTGMRQRLLGSLHRIFRRDGERSLGILLQHAQPMSWSVSDGALTTALSGAPDLDVALNAYTMAELVAWLGLQGYTATLADQELAGLSALVLLDGVGDTAESNGDHLYANTSLLWSLIGAYAVALQQAKDDIGEMLRQLDIHTDAEFWLDFWGDRFGYARLEGETDAQYRGRLPIEIFQPRSNNLAIEEVIARTTGLQVRVVDIYWRPSSTLLHTNAPTVGGQFVQATNSAYLCGPVPDVWPERDFLTDTLGLTLINNRPYWGDPVNANLLVCAFAVLINADSAALSARDRTLIKTAVEVYRAAGTIGLYFANGPVVAHTNVAGEVSNHANWVSGPAASVYQPVTL